MGTLRIKRGTKTALQTSPGYVPAEGELVYTTDSKEVFVGDGATTGGTPVSVSTQNLEDLGNVQALAAQNDQILVYNGTQWAATDNPQIDIRGNIYGDDSTLLVDAINGKIVGPVVSSSVTATNVVGNLTGDVTGSVTGNVVGNTTGTHFGSVVGDMVGSVFADDSTVLIDSNNSKITGNVDTDKVTVGTSGLFVNGTGNIGTTARLEFGFDTQGVGAPPGSDPASTLVTRVDGQQKFVMQTRVNNTYMSHNDTGLTGVSLYNSHQVFGGLKVKIEPANSDFSEPTEALEVLGNAKATGFVQFGSLTTTQRDALTAANGMVIYNTSDNKFQGYENGSWANLI
jgi:hypothetical protein